MRSFFTILSRRQLLGASWVFATLNILIGVWAVYIPVIQEKLGLSDANLGMALFFMALGTLCSIPIAAYATPKWGCGYATIAGILLFCVAFLGPFLATSFWQLAVALFLIGVGSGFTDIAMNTLVSQIEKDMQLNFMSAAHGFFSLGGVIGAGSATLLQGLINSPLLHMGVMVIFTIMTNLILASSYIKVRSQSAGSHGGLNWKFLRPLLILGFIGAVIMASEGAMVDWSSLYLRRETGAVNPLTMGLGFTAFSVCMTLGRFFGDKVSMRMGSLRLMMAGAALALIGYTAILSRMLGVSIAGFGLLGIGYSIIVPELFRIAGNFKNIPPERGIAVIASFGYAGFLLGPVVLGVLSQQFGLWTSFLTLALGTLGVLLLLRNYKMPG